MISVAKSRRARGTALLLAIAMTLLLFIMGFAFLITTQNQTEIAVDTGLRISVDAGVDAVVEQINTVLTEDLFDENGNFLAGNGIVPGPVDTGEPWDYPSHFVLPGPDLVFGSNDDVTTLAAYQNDADPWLASIEPFVVDYRETPMDPSDDDVGFLHISDIYGTLARLFISGYDSSSGSLFFDDEGNTPGSVDRVSFRNLRATIIDPTAPIPSNPAFNTLGLSYAPGEGAKADADGDGVADSRWVKIPNLTGPGGEDFYAAVRIIDNCAMVNVNTALTFRNDAQTVPLTSQGSRQLGDGSRLTDINLIGLKRSTDDPTALNTYRSSITELDYHYDVARRLLNPVALPRSTLFGFDDEMEFRHRFFINNAFSGSGGGLRNILTPLETRWPLTFDNGSGQYSKWQPYDNSADLSEWYAKAFAHPAILTDTATDHYTRRHLITTYSFDRIVAPWPADRTTPVSFSTAPTINNDPMPTDFYNAWIEWTNWDNSDSSKWTFRPVPVNDIVANTHPAITALTDPIATLAAAIWLALPNNTRLTAGSAVFSSLAPFSEVGWSTTEIRDRLAGMFAANMVDYIDNVNDLPSTTVDDPTELIIGSDVFYGFEANGERLRFGLVGMSKTRPAPGDPPNEHFVVQIFNAGVVDAHLDDWLLQKWDNGSSNYTDYNLPSGVTLLPGETIVLIDENNLEGFQTTDFTNLNAYALNAIVGNSSAFDWSNDDKLFLVKKPKDGFVTVGTSSRGIPYDQVTIETLLDDPDSTDVLRHIGYAERGGFSLHTDPAGTHDLPVLETGVDLTDFKSESDASSNPTATDLGDLNKIFFVPSLLGTPLEFLPNDKDLLTAAELFRVAYPGAFYEGDTDKYFSEDANWFEFFNAGSVGSDEIWRGRFDPAFFDDNATPADPGDDESFAKLLQYLTIWAPFVDGVDNDGNFKSDNPVADGVDNDLDGGIDATDPDGPTDEDNAGNRDVEYRIAGRININTAPWFVIAQLPWIKDPCFIGAPDDKFHQHKLAQAVTAYRDKTAFRDPGTKLIVEPIANMPIPNYGLPTMADSSDDMSQWSGFIASEPPYETRKYRMGLMLSTDPDIRELPGFTSIEELVNVTQDLDRDGEVYPNLSYDEEYDFRNLGRNLVNDNSTANVSGSPTMRPFYFADDATDDIAERDALLQRISNLATVRSDTFTAYILVRLGTAGPQKRVIALFDRSNVFRPTDRPKLVYLHAVPEVN